MSEKREIQLTISRNSEKVESRSEIVSGDDLNAMMTSLKSMKTLANELLTKIVDEEKASNGNSNQPKKRSEGDESESAEDEEEEPNAGKKLRIENSE